MVISQREYRVPHAWKRIGGATAMTVMLVSLSRVAIPAGHGSTLGAGVLLARLAMIAVGVGSLLALLLDPAERASGWHIMLQRLRSARVGDRAKASDVVKAS
jgi:hypothetical protein